VVDLGSGSGLPGLVLALARPDLVVTLVEPMARRVEFLTEAVATLGIDHVTIVRGRAEDLAGGERFDVVTSRALAPLPRLLGWSLPLLAVEGAVLALKGSSAQQEIDSATADLARWRVRADVVVCEVPGVSPATVVRVVAAPGATLGWQASTSARRRRRERR
jgi:16S rRNA (guanine527-N7)-methyltransferase